jgi:hypothetical protein
MIPPRNRIPLALLAACLATPRLPACELCAIFSVNQAHGDLEKGFMAGVAEQYTHYGTLREDGREVPNPANQHLDSSLTQLLLRYNLSERVGAQFTAPLIYRSFQRVEHEGIQRGSESGLGDVSLTAHLHPYHYESMESSLAWDLLAGVKFPTGSTRRLKEETQEHEHEEGGLENAIHGHDLTLGSGSYDGIVGTSLYARWDKWFVSAAVQYAIRSQGDYDYEFADDLIWNAGPARYILLKDQYSLALQALVSGETKGRDHFRGERAEDTGFTAVYCGPQITVTWREKLSGEVGIDIPVSVQNTALQAVPDYRVRGAVTWRF